MKLIIDIPEYDYRQIKEYYEKNDTVEATYSYIYHGTPLPKGHGRIADMDDAIKCIKDVEGDDAIWAISLIEWACAKRTIIEADKAESEIHCNCTDEEVAKSFIEDVEAVKDLLPRGESEG